MLGLMGAMPLYMRRTEAAMLALGEIEASVARLIDVVRDEARRAAENERDALRGLLDDLAAMAEDDNPHLALAVLQAARAKWTP